MPNEKAAPGQETAPVGAITDFIKRALVAGIGVLFMTEEGIRSLLGELKLPKEAVQFVVGQVAKTKEDLFRVLAKELRAFLESADISGQLRKLLSQTALQVEAKVRFVPLEEDKAAREQNS